MPLWLRWVLGVYLIVCFLLFIYRKVNKDPINPAGYALPRLKKTIEEVERKYN